MEKNLQYFTRRSQQKYGTVKYDDEVERMVKSMERFLYFSIQEREIFPCLVMEEVSIKSQKADSEGSYTTLRRPEVLGE